MGQIWARLWGQLVVKCWVLGIETGTGFADPVPDVTNVKLSTNLASGGSKNAKPSSKVAPGMSKV